MICWRSRLNWSAGIRSVWKVLRISKRSVSRFFTSALYADLPSIFTRGSRFRMSKIVGRMSIVSTQASLTLAFFWPGRLDDQRHGRDLARGLAAQAPALARLRERHAVVRGDDDQRLVPEPLLLQPLPELLELVVGEAGLEEVPLEQHVELALVLVGLGGEPRDRVVRLAAIHAPGGQVLPRHVRHQRVLEVQRRAGCRGRCGRSTPGSAPRARGSGSRACSTREPRARSLAPRSGRRRRSCPSSRRRS